MTTTWAEANQQHVMAAIAVIRRRLERHFAGDAEPTAASEALVVAERAAATIAEQMLAPPALEQLAVAFGLSAFERDLLVFCAAPELDGSFSAHLAELGSTRRPASPTFGLALAALSEPHWSALLPSAPLRLFRLIDVGSGETLASSQLRIDERVLHYLAGVSSIDARLRPLLERITTDDTPPPSQMTHAARIVSIGTTHSDSIFQLCGRDSDGKRALSSWACGRLRAPLYAIAAGDIPHPADERDALARLWQREVMLTDAALYIDAEDAELVDLRRAALFAERLPGAVFIASSDPAPSRHRPAVRIDVGRPGTSEQHALWTDALSTIAPHINGHVDHVVGQFSLGARQIHAAATEVVDIVGTNDDPDAGAVLWDVCRTRARPRLDQLAQRIDSTAEWDDLVLPADQLSVLRQIAAQVRHRVTVYESWEFGKRGTRGLGISTLFSGASGTGKTFAAEVIAHELRLDLYRIDLSQVVSKYIGETEKNLRRIFDAAEEGGSVLLFDEADALFGKRSEVKDSHDRYANIEVSYLLQKMETYRGLAVLTTNLKSSIDTAFLRRIRFIVDFPFPDVTQRAAIWERVFPRATPTENVDVARLAQLNVSGGTIHNIALNAAFLAAHAGQSVGMGHLFDAARSECRKLERQVTDAELRGWK